FRNDGSGHFTLANILIPPGGPFGGVAAADLNHDGNLDLILPAAGHIIVYLGNGDLTFQPPIITDIPAFKFTLADFNGDGNLDVATIVPQNSFGTIFIALALGNGDGTFGPARFYPGASGLESAFRISWEIHAADVDRDGKVDVVVSNDASNDMSVFLGNGDGTLQPHQRYGIGYSPRFFAVADFTGDGVPDIAADIGLPFNGLNSAVALLPGLTTGHHPPVLGPLPGQMSPSSQAVVTVMLHATDPDGDPITYSATAQSLAHVLTRSTGTLTYSSVWDDWGGRGEKWLQASGGQWYFIQPN